MRSVHPAWHLFIFIPIYFYFFSTEIISHFEGDEAFQVTIVFACERWKQG